MKETPTCGHCGTKLIHRTRKETTDATDLFCPNCEFYPSLITYIYMSNRGQEINKALERKYSSLNPA